MNLAVKESAPAPAPAGGARILLVEDDRIALALTLEVFEELGYAVEVASNGLEALSLLRDDPSRADIVVTDRMMPILDGVALTRRLKQEPETAEIPVILLTSADDPEDISEGLKSGAFYYVSKPLNEGLVQSVIQSALKELARKKRVSTELSKHQSAFQNVNALRMVVRGADEVESVASLLASIHDRPEDIIQGVFELLQNAVEHGLLGFGYATKKKLMEERRWSEALRERSSAALQSKREVEATILRKDSALVMSIKDPGKGFNWRPYLTADMSRSSGLSGRGILRARATSFDRLAYNASGNQVMAVKSLQRRAVW